MTLGEQQEIFAKDIVALLIKAFTLGYNVRLGEAQRPVEMQEIYVRDGRSKTMNSQHLKKLAFDLFFTKNNEVVYPQELGDYWESLSPENRWGGNWTSFKDKPHYERYV